MEDKIYCGSGRVISGKFGDIIKISMHREDIVKIIAHMKSEQSDWINLEMKEKKEPQQGKPTHYIQVDTWKPSEKKTEVDDSDPFA